MFRIIDNSSVSNIYVTNSTVVWVDWKKSLGHFFSIPVAFKITRNHIFRIDSYMPDTVSFKQLTSSPTCNSFNILSRSVSLDQVRKNSNSLYNSENRMIIPPLTQATSTQQDNRKA